MTEEQLYSIFETVGTVRRVIMGLNRKNHTPCGFCFVEYYFHQDAENARDWLSGSKVDDRELRVDLDPGFGEGRQYGRGKSGGQIREDRRRDFDKDRGGWGARGPPKSLFWVKKCEILSHTKPICLFSRFGDN